MIATLNMLSAVWRHSIGMLWATLSSGLDLVFMFLGPPGDTRRTLPHAFQFWVYCLSADRSLHLPLTWCADLDSIEGTNFDAFGLRWWISWCWRYLWDPTAGFCRINIKNMFTAIKNLSHLGSDGYPKLSTSTILNKLSDCRPPGDKLKIGEYLEMVEIKLETFPIETAKELLKFSGLPIIFNIMRVMKDGQFHCKQLYLEWSCSSHCRLNRLIHRTCKFPLQM